jgi:hypothetical protein
MRLPRSPYIYFRFSDGLEILMHNGPGKGARADMAEKVRRVEAFAEGVFWPNGDNYHKANRHIANFWQGKPTQACMCSWDGDQRYTRWTSVLDTELTEISRYASSLLAGGTKR